MNNKLGIVYDVIKDRLEIRKDSFNQISENELNTILGREFHIPKHFRHIVIEELFDLGYIKGNRELQKRKRTFEVVIN